MYRIIIADDEPWVAYRLTRLVDWQALGYEVVATAQDGEEALRLCLEHRPEVLISDIRMPGLDGLELLHALRQRQMETAVVLISGYAEFSYAQQAIRDGAFDYLIKQVSAGHLTDVLTRLRHHFAQKKQGFDALFSLLDEDSTTTLGEWPAQLRRPTPFSRYRFYTFSIRGDEYPGLWHAHNAGDFDEIILRTGREKASTLLCFDEEAAVQSVWRLPDGYCGYSETASAEESFVRLFRQSDVAFYTAKFLQKNVPWAFRDDPRRGQLQTLQNEMEQALRQQNMARCQTLLSVFEAQAQGMNLQQIAAAYRWIDQLLTRYVAHTPGPAQEMDYRRLAQEFSSLQELTAFFRECLAAAPAIPDDSQIDQAIEFIDHSFTEELRISDLARRFHFSPSYFSTLFRKHTGKNFTKYVAEKRIAHAQSLLRNTPLPLQEIADQTGYGDYFQFNKTFKKHIGLTPGQYRREMASES